MNLFQSITTQTSSGEPADPVTCTQLTAQVALITAQLKAITTAITNLVQPGAAPVDLSGVIAQLEAITAAIANRPAAMPVDLTPLVNAIDGPTDTIAQAKSLQDLIIYDPAFPASAKQIFVL